MRGENLVSLRTFVQWCHCSQGPMTVAVNDICPSHGCGHYRCAYCHISKPRKAKHNGQVTQTAGWPRPNAAETPQIGSVKDSSLPKDSAKQSGFQNSALSALQQEPTKDPEELPRSDLKLIGHSSVNNETEEDQHILPDAGGSKNSDVPFHDRREIFLEQSDSQQADQSMPQSSHALMPQKEPIPNLNLETGHHSCITDRTKRVSNHSPKDNPSSTKPRPVISLVSAWLESIQEHQDFSAIARACKGFGDQELEDTNGQQSQRNGAVSDCRDSAKKAHYARGKQKTSTLGGSQGESSSAKLKQATQSRGSSTKHSLFACSFFKRDKRLYSACSNTRISSIGHLAEHLRKFHCRGEACCHSCWITFEDMGVLEAHATDGTCQPTNGKAPDTLEMPRTKNRSPWDKWYDIFRQLFPGVDPPDSPYWQSYEPTAAELVAYIRTNLPAMQVENVETVLDSVHTLYASFLRAAAESLNTQQSTSAFSSGSNEEGRSTRNTASESHQTHVGRSWTIPSSSAPTNGRESSLSQPTPSSLGGGEELTSHTSHSRQLVEARQHVPSLLPACPQSSEESSSPLTVVGPAFHIEMAPEEHVLDDTSFATPMTEAGSETDSREATDSIRPGDALYQPGNGFDFAGPCPEELQPGRYDPENLGFEPYTLLEPGQQFDSAENVQLEDFELGEFLNIEGS
ncbi:chromatin remodeling complex subunit [Apiospora marii]|uniref:Chromatin remodeling complex subunit n=1 Tax=Apiospora marii TaxID=335849 RepID=A0ABR1S905_9PEZI